MEKTEEMEKTKKAYQDLKETRIAWLKFEKEFYVFEYQVRNKPIRKTRKTNNHDRN